MKYYDMCGENMFCRSCGNEIDVGDKFCKHCGVALEKESFEQNISGNGNVNIGGVSDISNSSVNINNVYGAHADDIAYIDRTSIRELKLFGKSVKSNWFLVSGGVGFVGSLASIFSLFYDQLNLGFTPHILLVITGLLLSIGLALKLHRFLKMGLINIEAGSDDRVFFTKISGSCPKCNGDLKLAEVGPKDHKVTVVLCKRNPAQHKWSFDPTVLGDINSEFSAKNKVNLTSILAYGIGASALGATLFGGLGAVVGGVIGIVIGDNVDRWQARNESE
jgi:hypothetical protein